MSDIIPNAVFLKALYNSTNQPDWQNLDFVPFTGLSITETPKGIRADDFSTLMTVCQALLFLPVSFEHLVKGIGVGEALLKWGVFKA